MMDALVLAQHVAAAVEIERGDQGDIGPGVLLLIDEALGIVQIGGEDVAKEIDGDILGIDAVCRQSEIDQAGIGQKFVERGEFGDLGRIIFGIRFGLGLVLLRAKTGLVDDVGLGGLLNQRLRLRQCRNADVARCRKVEQLGELQVTLVLQRVDEAFRIGEIAGQNPLDRP